MSKAQNNRPVTIIAISLIVIAIIAGAFGAHSLKTLVSPERLAVWYTAVNYCMSQGLGLLMVSLLINDSRNRWYLWAQRLILSGVVIFSGSLYLLVLTNTPLLGAVTPIGGVAMILGWLALIMYFLNKSG